MIYFSNQWYQLDISETGEITIKDAQGANLFDVVYSATYGLMTNGESPVLAANQNTYYVRDASIFDVGDEIQIINKSLNEQVLHSASITSVDTINNVLGINPPTPANFVIPKWNSQSPVGTIAKKITSEISSFSSFEVTEVTTEAGKDITFTGETDKTTVSVVFNCLTNSAKIAMNITTTYKAEVKVFNESMIFTFVDAVSKIYRKNRQTHTDNFHAKYWLGNQGAVFGQDSRTCFSYNNPKVTSLELVPSTKKLTVNLDDMRDHRFRRLDQYRSGYSEGMWTDRNAAEFNIGDSKGNVFTVWAGMPVKEIPRLMLNPDGYLSTLIFESHADSSPSDQQRAVLYGSEDILPGQEATGGLVGNGLKATISYFYGEETYSLRGATWATDPNALTDVFDIASDIYAKGYDVCSHSVFWDTDDIDNATITKGRDEAIPFMSQHFEAESWIDHSPSQDVLCQTTEGLVSGSPAYMKDLWEQYGVKSFWNHSSEDVDPYLIDIIGGGRGDDSYRSPLYWKHPTVTFDFITRATQYNNPGGQYGWATNYCEGNLDNLSDNWGVHVQHTYLGMTDRKAIILENGKYIVDSVFEAALQRIAVMRDAGKINVATSKDMINYWLSLEKISFEYQENGDVIIYNDNDTEVKGVSVAIDTPYYGIAVDNVKLTRKISNESAIASFDIGAKSSRTIKMIEEKPYQFSGDKNFADVISFVSPNNFVNPNFI